jgi:hypothetical protein
MTDTLGLEDGTRDLIVLGGRAGSFLDVHGPRVCAGETCPIHNPSNHPLRTAPMTWSQDLGIAGRVCGCGNWHPDPDSLEHLNRRGLFARLDAIAVVHPRHCDGCCQPRSPRPT